MIDMLFGLIGFVFKNFFLIVGIGVLISIVHAIKNQSKEDAIVHKLSAMALLAVFLLHSFFYWGFSSDDDFFVYLAQCVLPAFVALFAGGVAYDMNCGTRQELIAIAIAYGVSYLFVVIFNSWIVSIITLLVGIGLAAYVISNVGKQHEMDYHTNDLLGDSEKVQNLYREGYRPTHYRDVGKKGQKVRDNLRKHGVQDE